MMVRIKLRKQLHVCLIVRVVSGGVTLLEPVTRTDGIITAFKLLYDRQSMFESNNHIHFFNFIIW